MQSASKTLSGVAFCSFFLNNLHDFSFFEVFYIFSIEIPIFDYY